MKLEQLLRIRGYNTLASAVQGAKQVGPLYHYTCYESALKILKSDKLTTRSGWISFTRNKNLHRRDREELELVELCTDVRLEFDGDRLSNRYRIEPYQYEDVPDEDEERVSALVISPVKHYLRGITIFADSWSAEKRDTSFEDYLKKLQQASNTAVKVRDCEEAT